uniref:Uncharacterized protein n=1 Tax=viral metagenome TaxID=1070528 RepID=A0A6C0DRA6_9ZZZZ
MERVRVYQVFSVWIFLAAVLSPLTEISLFPLLVITLPFGFPFPGKYGQEYLWKNLYGFSVHFLPFIWTRWVYDIDTVAWNIGLVCLYLLTMNLLRLDIVRTYQLIMTQKHSTLWDFLKERFDL